MSMAQGPSRRGRSDRKRRVLCVVEKCLLKTVVSFAQTVPLDFIYLSASLRNDGKSSALAVDDTDARIGFRSKCVARFPIDRLRLMIDRASLVAWRTGDLTKMWGLGALRSRIR